MLVLSTFDKSTPKALAIRKSAKQILLAWVLLPEEKLEGGLEMQYRSGEALEPGEITVFGCRFD
jgi:hypothetical protein